MSEETKKEGIQIFKGIAHNKAKETADLIKSHVLEGTVDVPYLAIALKRMAKVQELINEDKELKTIILDEIDKLREGNKKTVKLHNASVTVATRSWWDYSTTEDPLRERLLELKEHIDEQLKAREKELQTKAEAWEKQNAPKGGVNFTLLPFTVHVDALPELEWKEALADIETNPPVKKGTDSLRMSV